MRRIVRSQFSIDARLYEMRDIRPLSSERWQLPHRDRTSALSTGMPSSVVVCCAYAGLAPAQIVRTANTNTTCLAMVR
jgi:hypothetical protein